MRSWHIAAAVTVRGAQPPLSRGAAVCTLPGGWPGAKAPGRPRSGAEGAPSLPGSRLLPTRAGACWQLEIGIARAPGRFYTQAAAGAGPGTQAASGRAQGKAPEPLVQRAQCTGTVGTGTAVTGKVRTDLWPGPPALPAGAAHFRVTWGKVRRDIIPPEQCDHHTRGSPQLEAQKSPASATSRRSDLLVTIQPAQAQAATSVIAFSLLLLRHLGATGTYC